LSPALSPGIHPLFTLNLSRFEAIARLNYTEADWVRTIFRSYLRLGSLNRSWRRRSVAPATVELDADGNLPA
jgi:hypothetical protein